jgi:polysaccharide biosynthesis transport protein
LALARLRAASNGVVIPKDRLGEPLPVTLRVAGSAKSSVFLVEATGSSSSYVQAYLDALMNVYLEYKKNIRRVVSGDTLNSIYTQVKQRETELNAEQEALVAFQRSNNLAIVQQEATISGGYLATLKTRRSELELESRLLQAYVAEPLTNAGSAGTSTNLNPEWVQAVAGGSAGASNERQTAAKELELLKLQRDRLSKYLRPKHPKIARLNEEIERGEKLLEIYRRQSTEQLAASREAVRTRMEDVDKSIREWEAKVLVANARIAEAERLKLNVQRVQQVYERLAMLVNNVGISRNIDQETLAILEPASLPKRSYTKEISQIALGVVGGMALGLGIILLLALRDDRFTTLRELNQRIGAIVVGQVPKVPSLKSQAALPLLEGNDSRHAYAESFRNLRSALIYMAHENERPHVVLVTSALPHEGKSTVAANLARALALGGSQVVLVDGDLRKGTLHNLLSLPCEPGLANILNDPNQLDSVIQKNCLSNLGFISRGTVSSHSGDLLLGPAFDRLLLELRHRFDYVIIDSSPIFAADDATTLAPKVDGTLFVVRSRFSRTGPVRDALDLLYQRNARVLGVIFNQADTNAGYYYYKNPEYYAAAKDQGPGTADH